MMEILEKESFAEMEWFLFGQKEVPDFQKGEIHGLKQVIHVLIFL